MWTSLHCVNVTRFKPFFSPTSSTALCASISSSSLNEIHSKSGNNINYHSSKYSDSCFKLIHCEHLGTKIKIYFINGHPLQRQVSQYTVAGWSLRFQVAG